MASFTRTSCTSNTATHSNTGSSQVLLWAVSRRLCASSYHHFGSSSSYFHLSKVFSGKSSAGSLRCFLANQLSVASGLHLIVNSVYPFLKVIVDFGDDAHGWMLRERFMASAFLIKLIKLSVWKINLGVFSLIMQVQNLSLVTKQYYLKMGYLV